MDDLNEVQVTVGDLSLAGDLYVAQDWFIAHFDR